jgi:multimeric flavodoxin WrbA
MKILIINGSQRKNGNSWRFARYCKDIATEHKHTADVIDLEETRFDYCDGCLSCEDIGECVIKDAFNKVIVPKIKESDMIIFASPVYYNMPTAMMKNFIDRSNGLYKYFKENKKKVATFLVGQADEASLAFSFNCFKEYYTILDLPEAGEPILKIARDPDELVLGDEIKAAVIKWLA